MGYNYVGLREWLYQFFLQLGADPSIEFYAILADILSLLAIPFALEILKLLIEGIQLLLHSGFTGRWEQFIYDPKSPYVGTPVKVDYYRMWHFGFSNSNKLRKNIKGTIRRKAPNNESNRKWKFYGYLDGDILTIIYSFANGRNLCNIIYVKNSKP